MAGRLGVEQALEDQICSNMGAARRAVVVGAVVFTAALRLLAAATFTEALELRPGSG